MENKLSNINNNDNINKSLSEENSEINKKESNNLLINKKKDNFFKKNYQNNDFFENVVSINRVTKVTKGGRNFRFAAIVVVGDKKGMIGLGTGKANEVPDAIKKAIKEGKKNLIKISIIGTTISHEIIGKFGAGLVMLKPAKKGTGIIAGGPVRSVMELAGLSDVYTKSLGSNTPINMIRATLQGLNSLKTIKQVYKLRDKNIN